MSKSLISETKEIRNGKKMIIRKYKNINSKPSVGDSYESRKSKKEGENYLIRYNNLLNNCI